MSVPHRPPVGGHGVAPNYQVAALSGESCSAQLETSQEQPIAAGIDEPHLAFLLMDDGVRPQPDIAAATTLSKKQTESKLSSAREARSRRQTAGASHSFH